MRRAPLVALTLLAFALRFHALGAVTLRWDEGWSIALARLGPAEMAQLTRLDVHPPLYYLLLAPWLALGAAPDLWPRGLSALAATAAVPLAAAAAMAWWAPPHRAGRLTAVFAAASACLAPALVYYAGVTRMYALAATLLLAAAWGLARYAAVGRNRNAAVAILGATAALHTFYYTGFALAGLFAAALLAWPRAWRRVALVAGTTALLFLPWLAWVLPSLGARAAAAPAAGGGLGPALGLLDDGLNGALFVAEQSPWASALVLAVVFVGAWLARPRRLSRLAVVVLPVALVLLGAGAGAGAHMFAPRYVLVATPFLALGLGRGLAGLWQRGPLPGALGLVAVLAPVLPLLGGYAYERRAEVTAAFDPAADWRALAGRVGPGDVVAFNILSLAGLYERYRRPEDPPWTYAQLWDPVHEPLAAATARLEAAARAHERLWLLLYQGLYAPDSAAAKAWADGHLYPLEGWWREGTLYQGYVAAPRALGHVPVDADFGRGVRLHGAELAGSGDGQRGRAIGVNLRWRAETAPEAKGRVFVHAYGPDGALLAQHDAFPVGDSRPTDTWAAGETLEDRHGLWLPPATRGPVTLRAGLYDPGTGERWRLPDGADSVVLGRLDLPDGPARLLPAGDGG